MRHKLRTCWTGAGIVILTGGILAAAGCDRPNPPAADAKAGAAAPSAPAAASIVHPQRKALRRVVEQPGTIQAYEETPLIAKLPGYVRKVNADIGQKVRGPKFASTGQEVEPGEILAEIAIPEMGEEARQKEAQVRQTKAEIEQARKALAAAQANVASAEAATVEARAGLTRARSLYDRWQSEASRMAGLAQGGVLDIQSRDETANQFRAAEAGRAEAEARIVSAEAAVRKAKADRDKIEADVKAAEAKRDVARADALRVQALLSYTKIRAPYDGTVTRRRVNTGEFLQPGTAKAEGIFTVARLDPVRVVIEVPETDAALVRDEGEAKIAVQALPGPELAGKVKRNSWSLAPGSRTLRTEIDLPNPDGRLRPGMYVYARINVALPEAWVLPSAALVKQGDVTVCYLVEGGKAVRTPVQVGRSDAGLSEVRKRAKPGAAGDWEDFTGKETVATPAASLTDGQPVSASVSGS
jgi:RND family efflux transporter MFP subunit